MGLKQALHRWLQRHQTGPNRLLHALGIPATIVGLVLLLLQLWWLAALCFVAGYVLQVIGHYLEGSQVGEVILLKKMVLPTGGFARRFAIISLLVLGLLVGGLLAQTLIGRCIYFNLYETVAPGMSRSGKMPSEHLDQLIQRLGIKTVVILRTGDGEAWYTAERQMLRTNGIESIHLPLAASVYPDPEKLNELLDLVERIEPPFLVHCNGGADRTGLFFVLLALREGRNWPEAMRQLSLLRFGYYGGTRSATITYPLYDFADYASQYHWPQDLEHFRRWLKSDHARRTYQRWMDRKERLGPS